MASGLTLTDLNYYQNQVKQGGVNKVVEFYNVLDNLGYDYSGWAKGVASENTIAGQAAVSFLKGTALMGLGGDQCRNLSSTTLDVILICPRFDGHLLT